MIFTIFMISNSPVLQCAEEDSLVPMIIAYLKY